MPLNRGGVAKPWLLRDSQQGLGFLTLDYMEKRAVDGKRKVFRALKRFYFDEETKQWSVCRGGDDLEQKHAALELMKEDPDKTRYGQYLGALNQEASMRQLFDLITSRGFEKSDNQKYMVIVQPENASNENYQFIANLSQQFTAYERLDELVLTDVPGSLFYHAEIVPAESAAPDRSRSPGINPI